MKEKLFAAILAVMLLGAGAFTLTVAPSQAATLCGQLSGNKLTKCIDREAAKACAKIKTSRSKAKCKKIEKSKLQQEIRNQSKAKRKPKRR